MLADSKVVINRCLDKHHSINLNVPEHLQTHKYRAAAFVRFDSPKNSDLYRELSVLYSNAQSHPPWHVDPEEGYDNFKRTVLEVLTKYGSDIPEIQTILLSPKMLATWSCSYSNDQPLKIGIRIDGFDDRYTITEILS